MSFPSPLLFPGHWYDQDRGPFYQYAILARQDSTYLLKDINSEWEDTAFCRPVYEDPEEEYRIEAGDTGLDAFVRGDGATSSDPDFIQYFNNNGTARTAVFDEQTGGANPFDGVEPGPYTGPSFVDIDGDNDFDAFIGEKTGTINYFENTGTDAVPSFIQHTDPRNPFYMVDVGHGSNLSFVDINNNGRTDAFTGSWDGKIQYYNNYYFPWNIFYPAMLKKK